jgi:CheY-like chemotaxis protein
MDVPENMREAVEVINDGASRVVGIVDKLLTFARRDRPDKEHADINAILTNTLAMRAYEMRTGNVEVETSLAQDLTRTMIDVGQIQQVFLNLIVNAEQAMSTAHGHGTLRIVTERVGGRIQVSFADDGPGIPDGVIDKLFDPFFTTKRDGAGGTGLGLSISRGIVEEQGGKIYARSLQGRGATFVVELPMAEPAVEAPPPEPPRTEVASARGARILVVDDEPHICTALDRLLTREGHSVETISEATKALEKLRDNTYDLVLMDLRMPGMNGIEFYERMKEISPSLERRVVCVTGDVVSGTNKDFLQETGLPCVAKPFGVQDLVQQIREVLEGNEKCASHVF